MNWQFAIPVIALIISAAAFIRASIRPKLALMQQSRWGRNYFSYVNSEPRIGISVLVLNPRPQPNAIVGWAAEVKSHGRFVDVRVPSGELQFPERTTQYGVMPLMIAGFAAVEAHLCLFDLPNDLTVPVELRLAATDVFGKKHRLQCVIDKAE
jgi:hypothetical protein